MFLLVRNNDNLTVNIEKDYLKLLNVFATNLKSIRSSKGLTQENMTQFGFNYRHYQKLESGKHAPSLYTLVRLAKILKVRPEDFLAAI